MRRPEPRLWPQDAPSSPALALPRSPLMPIRMLLLSASVARLTVLCTFDCPLAAGRCPQACGSNTARLRRHAAAPTASKPPRVALLCTPPPTADRVAAGLGAVLAYPSLSLQVSRRRRHAPHGRRARCWQADGRCRCRRCREWRSPASIWTAEARVQIDAESVPTRPPARVEDVPRGRTDSRRMRVSGADLASGAASGRAAVCVMCGGGACESRCCSQLVWKCLWTSS